VLNICLVLEMALYALAQVLPYDHGYRDIVRPCCAAEERSDEASTVYRLYTRKAGNLIGHALTRDYILASRGGCKGRRHVATYKVRIG
jgi:hypothetical protein